jgi:redox-sensitive bicupin YhaK (pirin superfamily)
MITLLRSQERGSTTLRWLDSRHGFFFNDYYDAQHMGFSDLRVINEDLVEPGAGFPRHSHRDMEIITYVLEGMLAHHLGDDRHAWVQVIRGAVRFNGTSLTAGNGAAMGQETVLQIHATGAAELLLFDLA